MSMEYIRKTYGVPAKRGARIRYNPPGDTQFGTIVGSSGAYLKIRIDGDKVALRWHPTTEGMTYLPVSET